MKFFLLLAAFCLVLTQTQTDFINYQVRCVYYNEQDNACGPGHNVDFVRLVVNFNDRKQFID
jgi:hypothetical protein